MTIRTWAWLVGLLLAAAMVLGVFAFVWVLGEKYEPGLRVDNRTNERLIVGALRKGSSRQDLLFQVDVNSSTDMNTGYGACLSTARWVAFNRSGQLIATFNPRREDDCGWNMTWVIEEP